MIINVRGTHGSGKTTLVRSVMAEYRRVVPIFVERRRIPLGYKCTRPRSGDGSKLFIVGSYESKAMTGGCDNIRDVATMYGVIRKYARRKYHVLYEGIVAQHSTPNIIKLDQDFRVRIVVLDISLETAVRDILRRRKKLGIMEPFNTTNTEHEISGVKSSSLKLERNGVKVFRTRSRIAARERVFTLLGLNG